MGYLTQLNLKIFYGSCCVFLMISSLILKLCVVSSHLLESNLPVWFLLGLLLVLLILSLILTLTLWLSIPLLIFPGEIRMILPTRIVSIRVRIILLQKVYLYNLLRSSKTEHRLMGTVTDLTTNSLSLLNLSDLLSSKV